MGLTKLKDLKSLVVERRLRFLFVVVILLLLLLSISYVYYSNDGSYNDNSNTKMSLIFDANDEPHNYKNLGLESIWISNRTKPHVLYLLKFHWNNSDYGTIKREISITLYAASENFSLFIYRYKNSSNFARPNNFNVEIMAQNQTVDLVLLDDFKTQKKLDYFDELSLSVSILNQYSGEHTGWLRYNIPYYNNSNIEIDGEIDDWIDVSDPDRLFHEFNGGQTLFSWSKQSKSPIQAKLSLLKDNEGLKGFLSMSVNRSFEIDRSYDYTLFYGVGIEMKNETQHHSFTMNHFSQRVGNGFMQDQRIIHLWDEAEAAYPPAYREEFEQQPLPNQSIIVFEFVIPTQITQNLNFSKLMANPTATMLLNVNYNYKPMANFFVSL